MKHLRLFLFVIIAVWSREAFSQLKWPLSNSFNDNADVITSAFGPRTLPSGSFDIHYGLDMNKPNGGKGDQIFAPVNIQIKDIRNGGDGTGYLIEASFNDDAVGEESRLRFLHLDQDPRNLGLETEDIILQGDPIPGAFVGNSGIEFFAAHLHLDYFPEFSRPANQFNDVKLFTENPIQVLPRDYPGPDYHVSNPIDGVIEKSGADTWFSFYAEIGPRRLDLNRIEVSFNGYDKNATEYQHNDVFGDPIIESQRGFAFSNDVEQEIGVIDFHQRIGFDYESDSPTNTFNGVKIEPAELVNSSSGGYQNFDHSYKFSFKLDNRVLREVLVGGLYNVNIKLVSTKVEGNPGRTFSFDREDIAVQWQQEWMANTIFPSDFTVSNYHVKNDGAVLILNQNSSESNHPMFGPGQTLTLENGGAIVLQDGTASNRTWFTNHGNIELINGTFNLGEQSRFVNKGTFNANSSSNVNYLTGGGEFINMGGTVDMGPSYYIGAPESCFIPMGGSVSTFHDDITLENGGFIMTWSENAQINVDGNITARGSGNNNGNVIELIAGTEVVMGLNKWIRVEEGAKIKAAGTSSNPVRFTSEDPAAFPDATWGRIQLFGGGSLFDYVIFEYGSVPLEISSVDNLITHSTFRNNIRAITSYKTSSGAKSQFRVLQSAFENHTGFAVTLKHANASIEHSRFINEVWDTGGAIYVYRSTLGNPNSSGGYFRRNEITNNRWNGLKIDLGGWVYDGFGSVRGGNLIHGNDQHEIFLKSTTSRLWTSTGGAHSNIHSSDSYKYIYNLAQTTSGENLVSWTVPAQNNWWGSSSGPSTTDFFGSVDYTPFLSTPTYQQGGPTTPPPSSVDDGGQQLTLQPAMSAAMAEAVTAEAQTLPEKERLLWVEQRLDELKELWANGHRNPRRARWLNGMMSLWRELPSERRQAHSDIPGYRSQSIEALLNRPYMNSLAEEDMKAAKAARLAGEAAMLLDIEQYCPKKCVWGKFPRLSKKSLFKSSFYFPIQAGGSGSPCLTYLAGVV